MLAHFDMVERELQAQPRSGHTVAAETHGSRKPGLKRPAETTSRQSTLADSWQIPTGGTGSKPAREAQEVLPSAFCKSPIAGSQRVSVKRSLPRTGGGRGRGSLPLLCGHELA